MCLGQADVLERLRCRNGYEQGARIGVPDVLRGEDHHSARDEAGILAAFEHRGEVVDSSVGIAATHRLDERGDDVVVLVAVAVVSQRPLSGGVGDVARLEDDALGRRRLPGQLEGGERAAGITSGFVRDRLDHVGRNVDPQLARSASGHSRDLVVGERLQLDDGAAREQCGVDLEVGVLGRGTDQRQQAALDAGKEGILLGLVEAVDLVEEQDRSRPVCSEPVTCALEDAANVVDACRNRRELLEGGTRGLGDDAREGRLPDPGRAVEDHRRRPVALDREPKCGSVRQDVTLADELVERPRADALRERGRLGAEGGGRIGEEVGHRSSVGSAGFGRARSMSLRLQRRPLCSWRCRRTPRSQRPPALPSSCGSQRDPPSRR